MDEDTIKNWLRFLNTNMPHENWPVGGQANPALKRQIETTELIIRSFRANRRGHILADDVGLGKTWVGIMLAVAFASAKGKVVISAPNQTMQNKWANELEKWYGDVAPYPGWWSKEENGWKKLHPGEEICWVLRGDGGNNVVSGRILLITHRQFQTRISPWNCDLMIIDEAHRGQNNLENMPNHLNAAFVALLTATPFGINHNVLLSMLRLVGCDEENDINIINEFFQKSKNYSLTSKDVDKCIKAISPWIIRHSSETISKKEISQFGSGEKHILGQLISPEESEKIGEKIIKKSGIKIDDTKTSSLILHIERLKKLKPEIMSGSQTLVAPYARRAVKQIVDNNICKLSENNPIGYHIKELHNCCNFDEFGPMEKKLFDFAINCFKYGHKFIVFCYHHNTADSIRDVLNKASITFQNENVDIFRVIQKNIIDKYINSYTELNNIKNILYSLQYHKKIYINNSFEMLIEDIDNYKSVINKLDNSISLLGNYNAGWQALTNHLTGDNIHRDALIRLLFNSPFNPQALVLTTKDSEGIDLHHHCRILVHYELGYRSETLLQANGRIRRLGSLAARENKPVLYYYPYLEGTRSEVLTEVVLKRAAKFGMLMGGIPDLQPNGKEMIEGNMEVNFQKPVDLSNARFRRTL